MHYRNLKLIVLTHHIQQLYNQVLPVHSPTWCSVAATWDSWREAHRDVLCHKETRV